MFDGPCSSDGRGKFDREAPWEANRIKGIPMMFLAGAVMTAPRSVSLDAIEQACLSKFQKRVGQKCRSIVALEQQLLRRQCH
jgi:hypothetical protein